MYSRRPAGSSQKQIHNLSGYLSTRRTPRGAVSLRGIRGLGATDSQLRYSRFPEGGYIYDGAGNIVGVNPGNPRVLDADLVKPLIMKPLVTPLPADVVPQQSITPNIYTTTSSNYVAPATPAVASTGFNLGDIPWWGWAIAAYFGYELLGGSR